MKFISLIAAGLLGACAVATAAAADDHLLADEAGMTLYTFDNDGQNVSNCSGGCARSWPPYLAEDGAAAHDGLSVFQRADGRAQWAYEGQPLYYWQGDSRPGQANGDGVGGVWHVVER